VVQLLETWGKDQPESILNDFRTYVNDGYRGNTIVFAVLEARVSMVSMARFVFRNRLSHEITREHPSLRLLESPWPNGRARDLITRMELDASLAGNAYVLRDGQQMLRLRPDWVQVLNDGRYPSGYLFTPGGNIGGTTPQRTVTIYERPIDIAARNVTWLLTVEQIAHYAPKPDPASNYRGLSWLTPVAREIDADTQLTKHKQKFLDNAATPNLLITVEKSLSAEARRLFREEILKRHEGVDNAYRTMLLDNGADATVIGADMRQMTFTAVQGAGETRIAAAGGVPPVIVGLSEGLQAATYSNYQLAMRRFADLTAAPIWAGLCDALSTIVDVPAGMELTYDTSMIPALQQDALDDAQIVGTKARTMMTLIQAGYDPDGVAAAVDASDLSRIEHTGNIPTTLYPDGQKEMVNERPTI
jgi:HK97 family phage portal protein